LALEAAQVSPGALVIEITEHERVTDVARLVAVADEYAPEPSRPEPAECQPSQPSQDWQALQDTEPESDVVVLDYGLEQDVSPFDEDEWGLLGFDDV
jgi:hypothetical protein